jgi:hypothetical protein
LGNFNWLLTSGAKESLQEVESVRPRPLSQDPALSAARVRVLCLVHQMLSLITSGERLWGGDSSLCLSRPFGKMWGDFLAFFEKMGS